MSALLVIWILNIFIGRKDSICKVQEEKRKLIRWLLDPEEENEVEIRGKIYKTNRSSDLDNDEIWIYTAFYLIKIWGETYSVPLEDHMG